MTSTVAGNTLAGLADEFAELVSRMQQVDLVPASDDEVLGFWRSVETQVRRLAVVDHRVIAEVEQRGLPGRYAYASTAALVREVLRVAPGEARARVDAAHQLVRGSCPVSRCCRRCTRTPRRRCGLGRCRRGTRAW